MKCHIKNHYILPDNAKVEVNEMSFRSFLYTLARLLGDVNAVKKGKVGTRVKRRVAGKAAGKFLRKL